MASDSSLFTRALAEFISDLEKDPEGGSRFYQDILAHMKASFDGGPVDHSKVNEEQMVRFIEELDRKQQETSKTRKLFRKLRPFVSSLSQFTAAGDVMIQAAPDAAVLLYGGARLVLILAESFDGCFERILSIMEEVGDLLACYRDWSEVFAGHADMEELLLKTYKNIVSFWKGAHMILSQRGLRMLSQALRPLNEKWSYFHQRLLSDSNRVQMRAIAIESRIRKQKELDERCQQVLKWIKGGEDERKLDVTRQLRTFKQKRYENTCDWIFHNQDMEEWLQAKESTAIWYNGGPGTGKTIISAAVSHKLRDDKGKTITHFCSFDDDTLKRPITIFRSLILQLLGPKDPIDDDIMRRFEEDVGRHKSHLTDLVIATEILSSLLCDHDRVHIIIDGLDECEDREELLVAISDLLRQKKHKIYGTIKWFFTSREDESSIRDCMLKNDVHEITATKDSISKDISTWLSSQLECHHCVDVWTGYADGNFLWMSHMLPVLKGESATCDEEIQAELKRFPKGLTGCYARTLSQLSKRFANYDLQRRLARLIFTMVVGAKQPLRLSELSQALAASKGTSQVIRRDLIKDLGSNLIAFDSSLEDNDDDPFVKVTHKSVSDFFKAGPESLGLVDPDVRQYFVSREEANLVLGDASLKFMNALGFCKPKDVFTVATAKERSFLNHAATFWHYYLSNTNQSRKLGDDIIQFVRSEEFWTCIAAQCHIAPYLHAVFTRFGTAFNLESSAPGDKDEYELASPLPDWIENHKPEGPQVIEAYHSFVQEWHPVLTKHPFAMDQCALDFKTQMIMPGRVISQSDRVKILSLHHDTFPVNVYPVCISDIRLNSKEIAIKTLEYSKPKKQYNTRWLSADGSPQKVKDKTTGRAPAVSAALSTHDQFMQVQTSTGSSYYTVDIDRLTVRRNMTADESSEDFKPSNIGFIMPNKDLAGWQLKSKVSNSTATGYHCTCTKERRSVKPRSADSFATQESGYASMGSPDILIDHESDTDSDSDSSSDSDSDSESDGDRSDAESDITKLSDFNHKDANSQHCMLIVREGDSPLWHFWHSSEYSIEAPCAFHPEKPIAVWSECVGKATLLELLSGKTFILDLPEPSEADFSSAIAIRKEFHFIATEGRDRLYYFLYTASESETGGIKHKAMLSRLELSSSDGLEYTLKGSSTPTSMTYERGAAVQSPFILTNWCDNFLYVAFPSLSCDPKIVRVQLEPPKAPNVSTSETPDKAEKEVEVQTLKEQVYFPFSTQYRHPRLRILGRKSTSRHLTMALILEAQTKVQPSTPSQCAPFSLPGLSTAKANLAPTRTPFDPDTRDEEISRPPTVLLWDVHTIKDWREWDAEKDSKGADVMDRETRYEMLRGGFLDKNKRFEVTTRSGLDWTRKAFMSCA